MKCKSCPDYHAGTCTAIGEGNCAFPVTPESECVLDRMECEAEPEEQIRMPFPGMRPEDVERRYSDETGAYLVMKDGSLLHSENGIDWVLVTPDAAGGKNR